MAAPRHNPVPPSLPDRYEPGAMLGQGGMGRVWAAQDKVLDVPVAIKVLRPRVAKRRGFLLRFHREVALQARLHHPNLVPLHDAGQTPDGTPFVAMALADLGSLARYLPSGLPWRQAVSLADELLAALSALHARGVIHLDLKPENVLLHMGLDQRPHVWLADLGIARLMAEPGEGRRAAMGTPAFMPPEQRAGRLAELDRRSDLFAVGRILAQLVGEYDVPAGLAELLLGLAHPERLCRPNLAADVRLALDALGPPLRPLPPLPQALLPRSVTTWVTDLDGLDAMPPPLSEPLAPELPWVPWQDRPPPPPPATPPEETSGEASLRASIELYAHREIPIVGRERERGTLWSMARATREHGQPGVALIVGEAGAGKTRLVESLVRALEEGGWAEALHVRYQRGAPAASGMRGAALQLIGPWNEAPEQTRTRLERWFERVLPGVPSGPLASLGARAAHDPAPEREDDASWATQLVQWVLHTRCRRGLTVLVVEDAHLSEEPAEGLDIPLRMLNRAALGQPAPVLVICTLRSEALGASLELRRRVELLCSRGAERVDLPRLDRGAMEQLLAGSLDLAPELREVVASRCEGNPLLARMLITSWASQGMLEEVGDLMYTLAPGVDPSAAMPEDARSLFLDRAFQAASSAEDPEVFMRQLTLLALAGRDLPERLLSILAEGHEQELRASGLVRVGEGRCRFDHQLLHEVLREAATLRDDMRTLYGQVARAWLRFGAASGEDVSVAVAEAMLAAGEARAAFEPLARATVSAWRQGRSGATTQLGEAAIRALEQAGLPDDHPGAAQAMAVTAAALTELPDLARAETLAQRGFDAAVTPGGRAEAGATVGRISLLRGDWSRARRQLEALIDELDERAPAEAQLQPLEVLAAGALAYGEPDSAAAVAERALRLLADSVPGPQRVRLQRTLALARRDQGALADAQLGASQALALAEGSGHELEIGLCHHALGCILAEREERPQALLHLHQAGAILSSVQGGGWSQEAQQARAEVHWQLGELDEARRVLSTVAQWGELRRIPMEAVRALSTLCLVELQAGDAQAAGRAGEVAARIARQQTAAPALDTRLTAARALAAARQGRWGPGLDLVDRLRNRGSSPRDPSTAWLYRQLASEAGRLGQSEVAAWLSDQAARSVERPSAPT
jgi:serine/threonine protein kinase/tetratricopeptide (TPR) repeat protein